MTKGDISQGAEIAAQGGLIAATDGLSVSAGRDLINRADLVSGGDIDLYAGRDLNLAAVQDVRGEDFTRGYRRSSSVEQQASRVTSARDIHLAAGRDIDIVASRVDARNDLSALAGRDLRVRSAADVHNNEHHYRSSRTRKDVVDTHTRQQGSELSAGGDLSLIAGNDLTAQASRLKAGDQAYLVGGNDVALVAANDEDYHYYYKKKKSGGMISRKSMKRDEVTDTRAVGTTVETGGDLTIVSGGDQTYEAARLDSGENLSLTSGGGITFAGALDTRTESHDKSKSNWAWQSAKGKGQTDQTLRQSELLAQGQTLIQAANGLNIDVSHIDQQTVSQTIDAMVTADPDLAWLKTMEDRGDVDWRAVKEIHDSWDYSQSGLGQGAALAISIAATAMMPGIGAGLSGAMMTAGAGSLAATGAVSLINNRGDLGATFDDTLSSDSLEGALIAAASAGAAQGLDTVWGGSTDIANGQTTGFNLSDWGDTGRFVGQRASQAVVDAGLQTAIAGGEFDEHLRQTLQGAASTVLEATLFHQVGDLGERYPELLADGEGGKIALHALAGGLAAEATGGDFSTGAAAAGANEALVEQLATLVDNDPQLLVAASKLTGLMAAGLVDGDVAQGAEIAGNATTYNYLRHAQFQDIADRLEQCTTPSCRDNIIDKALALSQQQDLEALQLCASGSSGCGDAVLASMTTPFEGVEFSKPETAASLRELMWENPGKNGAFAMAAANQDAATVVDALDPEDRLSPEQRAQAEETLAGVMSSGGIGADRGGYTGGRGVTKPSTGASGSGGKVDAGFPKGTFSKVAPAITKQLQKKFKHAEDFGVSGNYSPANAKKFNQAIQDHLNASGTKEISGMYRGHSVTFHTDSNSGLTVIQNPNGSFLSGWRLNSQQLQHVLKDGKL